MQMATFWRFLHPAFSVSRVQHISNLRPKFEEIKKKKKETG